MVYATILGMFLFLNVYYIYAYIRHIIGGQSDRYVRILVYINNNNNKNNNNNLTFIVRLGNEYANSKAQVIAHRQNA